MSAVDFYQKNCLNPMRLGNYDAAYEGLSEYFTLSNLSPGAQANARLLRAICLVAKMEHLFPADMSGLCQEFREDLAQYWLETAAHRNQDSRILGVKPYLDYFEQVIRFTLFEPVGYFGQSLLEHLQIFERESQGVAKREDLIQIWIAEIDRERRGLNTARRDHLLRAIVMGKTLLPLLVENGVFSSARVTLKKILADTVYYYHDEQRTFQDRAFEALVYLEEILNEVPNDPYAVNFRNDINQTLAKHTQIDRFNHDSRSILGSLNQTSKNLLAHCHCDPPMDEDLHILRRQIMTLRSIAMLAEGQDKALQPSSDEYEYHDIGKLIEEQLNDFQLPSSCLEYNGTDRQWELIPGMVSVVFYNLFKNSLEAYERKGVPLSSPPCRITIDYDTGEIHYYDEAGGIDPAVGDIFAPYTSSKGIRSRIGLGLTNARMAMRSMEGELELAPYQPMKGVHFILKFVQK